MYAGVLQDVLGPKYVASLLLDFECAVADCPSWMVAVPALLLDLNIYLFMLAQLGLAVNAIISALSPKAKRS